MAHIVHNRKKLLSRVNRIQGQIAGIKKALEGERECADVLQQIAACRGAMNGLMSEIMEGEVKFHVLSQSAKANSPEVRAAEQLIQVLRTYLK